MTAGLPLINILFTPLAKGFLIPLGLTAAGSATDAAKYNTINNFKWRNGTYNENS